MAMLNNQMESLIFNRLRISKRSNEALFNPNLHSRITDVDFQSQSKPHIFSHSPAKMSHYIFPPKISHPLGPLGVPRSRPWGSPTWCSCASPCFRISMSCSTSSSLGTSTVMSGPTWMRIALRPGRIFWKKHDRNDRGSIFQLMVRAWRSYTFQFMVIYSNSRWLISIYIYMYVYDLDPGLKLYVLCFCFQILLGTLWLAFLF